MSPEQAAKRAKEIVEKDAGNLREVHANLDSLLLEILSGLGYSELVDIFNNTEKWYA